MAAGDSWVGRTLGRYKIVELLGRGGMAEVYKGYEEDLDRYVAVKLMHPFLAGEQDFANRFRREARAMAALNHGNIVGVIAFGVEGDTTYLVMEYVSGGTLKDKIQQLAEKKERLSLVTAVRIALEIAGALSYAHARGMVHRDIKPANIMLNEEGSPVLTDFGIAKILSGPSYTATGAMIGTPAYMSPEQGLGKPGDERSDIYALGVLFYQMVTGRLPFDADTPLAVVMKHVNEPVPLPVKFNPAVPAAIQQVILKSLAKDPGERFPSAHDMAKALRQAIRTAGSQMAAFIPPELLEDLPTPEPIKPRPTPTPVEPTVIGPSALPTAGTIVSAGDKTRVARREDLGATEVMAPIVPTPPAAATGAPQKQRWWTWALAAGVLILLAGGVATGAGRIFGGDRATPTSEAVAQATVKPTATAEPTVPVEEQPTPDSVATLLAAVQATQAALAASQPTGTSTPERTAKPSPTPTIDATAAFLANCTRSLELVDAYPYQNRQSEAVPIGATFPMNWILRNTGTCPWPAGTQWQYLEGETFGNQGSVTLEVDVPAGGEVTLTTSFVAPTTLRTYESTWKLKDEAGNVYGEPVKFALTTYVPATATPRPPTAIPTPAVSPTPVQVSEVDFGWSLGTCDYPTLFDWRCPMYITPTGGGGGPYTVWVFDADPPHEFRGSGTQTHFIIGRRCFPWIHEIRVQDDATGKSLSKNIYLDPQTMAFFSDGGNCTQP